MAVCDSSLIINNFRPGGGFGGLGLGGLDSDPFGLRSMSMNSGRSFHPRGKGGGANSQSLSDPLTR